VKRIVECYSGIAYADRPTAFFWRRERRMVDRIRSRARTPDGERFDVLDGRGDAFILSYNRLHDTWQVEPASFSRPAAAEKTLR
jgi:hypothetical protein